MKTKLYIGCHTEERNEYGFPKFKIEVVLDVDDYRTATKILRGLEITARGLLNKDGELIKNMMEDGTIKLGGLL